MTFLMYVACGNVAYELPGQIRVFAQVNVKMNSKSRRCHEKSKKIHSCGLRLILLKPK